MTPQEKALQLIGKFKRHVPDWDCYWDSQRNEDDIQKDAAKCALDVVLEILSALNTTTGHCSLNALDLHQVESDIQYWVSVGKILEAMK
jgi:hypothetical protein